MRIFSLSYKEVGPLRRPEPNEMEEDERAPMRSISNLLHPSQPQPLDSRECDIQLTISEDRDGFVQVTVNCNTGDGLTK
jgi:hypothetical protein